MARRLINWPSKLVAFVESRRDTRFAWGAHDCCMFAADAVLAITGTDPAEEFRGYSTKEECRAILDEFGGISGVAEHVMTDHGFDECDVSRTKRGDVVIIRGNIGDTMGFIGPNSRPIGPKSRGWVEVGRDKIVRAWGVW